MASSASHSVAAVTPEPQLVITGLSRSTPPAANRPVDACPARPAGRPRRSRWSGTLIAPGMWPERTPGPRLRRLAAEAVGGARIDHLRRLVGQRHLHVVNDGDDAACSMRASNWRGVRCDWRRSRAAGLRAFHFGKPPSRMIDLLGAEDAGTSTTPAAPKRGRRRHRPRWCRRRRCRARRRPWRTVSAPGSMCGRSDWNGRRSRRCRRTPRREYGRRDIRPRRRASCAGR